LWTEFFANRDWPFASVVALVMLVILVGPIVLYEHLQTRALEKAR
jgi:putrescine transport system permease protein